MLKTCFNITCENNKRIYRAQPINDLGIIPKTVSEPKRRCEIGINIRLEKDFGIVALMLKTHFNTKNQGNERGLFCR